MTANDRTKVFRIKANLPDGVHGTVVVWWKPRPGWWRPWRDFGVFKTLAEARDAILGREG